MNVLDDPVSADPKQPSAIRALRRLNLDPSADVPDTLALCELLRAYTNDTVVRAQRNLNRQRAAAKRDDYETTLVYARGGREPV